MKTVGGTCHHIVREEPCSYEKVVMFVSGFFRIPTCCNGELVERVCNEEGGCNAENKTICYPRKGDRHQRDKSAHSNAEEGYACDETVKDKRRSLLGDTRMGEETQTGKGKEREESITVLPKSEGGRLQLLHKFHDTILTERVKDGID